MSTTVSDILTRALALSVANQGLVDTNVTADVQDVLARVNQMQQRAVTKFTTSNKTAFLTSATSTSSAANGGRTVDLSALTTKVQRLVRVELPSGVEVALVDPAVPTSELAPRYYTRGETLVEVSNDWDTTTANAVVLTLLYASRPTELDVSATGALTQAITIPDRHTDLLVYDLGAYLAGKDVGREESEVTGLIAQRDDALMQWIESSAMLGGMPAYTFDIPSPTPASKD